MVSGSLALLYFLLSFHRGRQGSGPDRGQSPVEWGDFPFVRQPGSRPSQPCLKPKAWLTGWLGLRSGWLGLRHGWLGLRPGWLGLRPGWLGLRPGWLGLRPGWLGLRPGWMAQRGGQTNGRMNGRTDVQKISPFYRTSSPIGAAAQKSKLTIFNLPDSMKLFSFLYLWQILCKLGLKNDF